MQHFTYQYFCWHAIVYCWNTVICPPKGSLLVNTMSQCTMEIHWSIFLQAFCWTQHVTANNSGLSTHGYSVGKHHVRVQWKHSGLAIHLWVFCWHVCSVGQHTVTMKTVLCLPTAFLLTWTLSQCMMETQQFSYLWVFCWSAQCHRVQWKHSGLSIYEYSINQHNVTVYTGSAVVYLLLCTLLDSTLPQCTVETQW